MKVEAALREIFRRCGTGIMAEPMRFRSAFYDLLDEWHYKDERIVFRNAIESGALGSLAAQEPMAVDTAAQVTEDLKRSHMTEEDAGFVVQCIHSVGVIHEIVLERTVLVCVEFLMILIVRGLTALALDGIAAIRQKI